MLHFFQGTEVNYYNFCRPKKKQLLSKLAQTKLSSVRKGSQRVSLKNGNEGSVKFKYIIHRHSVLVNEHCCPPFQRVHVVHSNTAVKVVKQNFVSIDQRHASVKLGKYFHQEEK